MKYGSSPISPKYYLLQLVITIILMCGIHMCQTKKTNKLLDLISVYDI